MDTTSERFETIPSEKSSVVRPNAPLPGSGPRHPADLPPGVTLAEPHPGT
jgi:hypothetical protein